MVKCEGLLSDVALMLLLGCSLSCPVRRNALTAALKPAVEDHTELQVTASTSFFGSGGRFKPLSNLDADVGPEVGSKTSTGCT